MIARCARIGAAWHGAWLDALGVHWTQDDRIWRALDPPPVIYFSAMTLAADAVVRDGGGAVCDSWSVLDLAGEGYSLWAEEPWFVRAPGPLRADRPPELEIVQVSTPAEVVEFERTSVRGFGGEDAEVETGSVHPAAILSDPAMTMLTGRVAGEPVAAAMSYRTPEGIGVYGVTTVASARGRGYASALTSALVDPAMPAVLAPSASAESMYRRLGFAEVGRLRIWQRT